MKYNFKNIAFFATATLAMGAFSACSNEIENIDEPQKETKTITFTATLGEDNSLSRTSHEEDTSNGELKLKVKWVINDIIYVGEPKGTWQNIGSDLNFKQFKVTEVSEDGKVATFSYTGEDITWGNNTTLFVAYGRSASLKATKDVSNSLTYIYQTTYYDEQYLKNFDQLGGITKYVDGKVENVKLDHIVSFLKFRMSGLPSGKITTINPEFTDGSKSFNQYARMTEENISSASASTTMGYAANSIFHESVENTVYEIYRAMPAQDLFDGKDLKITVIYENGDTYIGYLYGLSNVELGKVYLTPVIPMTKQQ